MSDGEERRSTGVLTLHGAALMGLQDGGKEPGAAPSPPAGGLGGMLKSSLG